MQIPIIMIIEPSSSSKSLFKWHGVVASLTENNWRWENEVLDNKLVQNIYGTHTTDLTENSKFNHYYHDHTVTVYCTDVIKLTFNDSKRTPALKWNAKIDIISWYFLERESSWYDLGLNFQEIRIQRSTCMRLNKHINPRLSKGGGYHNLTDCFR